MYEFIVVFCMLGASPDCASIQTTTDNCVSTLRDLIDTMEPTPQTQIRRLSCRKLENTDNPDNLENT